jgi:hypothetical protein
MHVYFIRISFTSFFLQIEFSTQPMVGPYNNAATAAVRAFSILSDERIRAGEIAVVSHAHQPDGTGQPGDRASSRDRPQIGRHAEDRLLTNDRFVLLGRLDKPEITPRPMGCEPSRQFFVRSLDRSFFRYFGFAVAEEVAALDQSRDFLRHHILPRCVVIFYTLQNVG